jgi:hypothetical protein
MPRHRARHGATPARRVGRSRAVPLGHALIEGGTGRHPDQGRCVLPADRLDPGRISNIGVGLPAGGNSCERQEQCAPKDRPHHDRRSAAAPRVARAVKGGRRVAGAHLAIGKVGRHNSRYGNAAPISGGRRPPYSAGGGGMCSDGALSPTLSAAWRRSPAQRRRRQHVIEQPHRPIISDGISEIFCITIFSEAGQE